MELPFRASVDGRGSSGSKNVSLNMFKTCLNYKDFSSLELLKSPIIVTNPVFPQRLQN